MQAFDEQQYKTHVGPHVMRGRPGDWEHAQRVADWARRLGADLPNRDILIMAALIHDIGWRDVMQGEVIDFDEMVQLEDTANANSYPFIREVLGDYGVSDDEINEVIRLVRAADTRKASQPDEWVIVDADNLSKLNIDHLKQKYERDSWPKLIQTWEKELSWRITTEEGRNLWPGLLAELKKEVEKTLSS